MTDCNAYHSTEAMQSVITQLLEENRKLRSLTGTGLVFEKVPETGEVDLLNAGLLPSLVPVPEFDVKPTGNHPTPISLIEGDNLGGLIALHASHQRTVSVIYIDPPYNTGSVKFAYHDHRFHRGVRRDVKNDPLRHSAWLSFMERRLLLARELLTDDGVIFISIDDREQAQLKILMDHIFGATNFVANAIRKVKNGGGNDSNHLLVDYEYTLVYRRSAALRRFERIPAGAENDPKYRYADAHVADRGKYYLREFQYRSARSTPSNWTIELPNGEHVPSDYNGKVGNEWRWGKKKFQWGMENDYIVFKKSRSGEWKVYLKQYQYADNNGRSHVRTVPPSAFMDYRNGDGTEELKKILGAGQFSYPKPVEFIKHLVSLHPNRNAIILDFFAGSGTTGHAVAELNHSDDGERSAILITSNECGEMDPRRGIAQRVAQQRLARVLTGENWADKKDHPAIPGMLSYYRVEHRKNNSDAVFPPGGKDFGDQLRDELLRNAILSLRENGLVSPYAPGEEGGANI